MHQTINIYSFRDAFHTGERGETFSYEGLGILFEYLEQGEKDTGQPLELDVVALCCDFTEKGWEDVATEYNVDLSECESDGDRVAVVRDYLEENTSICGEHGEGVFIFHQF
jgi:hypothetical protein